MFERKNYKRAAKEQLKGRWKIPVLSTLLIFVLLGIIAGATGITNTSGGSIFGGAVDGGFDFDYKDSSSPLSIILTLIFSCISIAFFLAQKSICNTMYSESRQIEFSDFITGLNQWWQAIRGALWYMLWVWLWSLLFLIPGIVKSYAYSMMFYLMAEYPKISVKKAMEISKELTRGYKGDLFVLDLSFIGWAILSTITCGIGYLWLTPYYQMTYTNTYHYLKQTAIDSNRIKSEDFE